MRVLSPLRIVAAALLLGFATIVGYLLLWPVEVRPVAWHAPPTPDLVGPYAPNRALATVNVLPLAPGGHGPEDVHVLNGYLYGGTEEGSLVRWRLGADGAPISAPAEVVLHTGGRPLGLANDADGRLIIADALAGLLRLEPDGSLTTLCDHTVDGDRLVFPDDVDVAPDGTIYFSDATRFDYHRWKMDFFESDAHGRLVSWTEGRGCEVVRSGLHFANGVAVSEDGSFLLVNEMTRYRVLKVWLTGDRKGAAEPLAGPFPGFPDGVSRGTNGVFWVAIASPRDAVIDGTDQLPFLRKVVARLPESVQPAAVRHPYALAIDGDGHVLASYQDPTGQRYGVVTSVEEHGGRLYLGSLTEPAAAWLPAPNPR